MTSRDRYPERGRDGDDPGLEQVLSDLERMGKASRASMLPVEDDMRIVRALQEREAAPERNERAGGRVRSLFARHRPLALAAAVALSVLMVMGATYAAAPVLTR